MLRADEFAPEVTGLKVSGELKLFFFDQIDEPEVPRSE